jgi:hypothetical protein
LAKNAIALVQMTRAPPDTQMGVSEGYVYSSEKRAETILAGQVEISQPLAGLWSG